MFFFITFQGFFYYFPRFFALYNYFPRDVHPPSDKGTEMMTPLPVPIQSLFDDTRREVMRTKEKPSFPVPAQHKKLFTKAIQSEINILLLIYIYIYILVILIYLLLLVILY